MTHIMTVMTNKGVCGRAQGDTAAMRRLLISVLSALLLPAAAARAAEVHVEPDGRTVVYTAAPGETNRFTASNAAFQDQENNFTVTDGVPVTTGNGCAPDPTYSNTYNCQLSQPGTFRIDLGDGTDEGIITGPGILRGGAGDDLLKGRAAAPQTLDGGDGNDSLEGDTGTYCNVGGQDPIAADDLIGGAGTDTVIYDRQTAAVTVTLDDRADDGAPTEGDNVHADVENVDAEQACGGVVNSVTGTDGPNVIKVDGVAHGQGGDDVLTGSGTLDGGAGNDKLMAGSENDILTGGDGDDYLEGGFGDDVIDGGKGKDSYVGDTTASNTIGVGNDTINARDGVAESVACGPGSDKATVDADDDVAIDTQNLCEEVDRAKATTPTGPGSAGPKFVFIAATPVKVRKGSTRIKVTCLTDTGCNGRLKLTKGKKTLASKAFSIAPGKSAKVKLKVKRPKKTQTVLATATSKPAASTVSVRLKLKR